MASALRQQVWIVTLNPRVSSLASPFEHGVFNLPTAGKIFENFLHIKYCFSYGCAYDDSGVGRRLRDEPGLPGEPDQKPVLEVVANV